MISCSNMSQRLSWFLVFYYGKIHIITNIFYFCILELLHNKYFVKNEDIWGKVYSHKNKLARLCITLPSGDCAIIQLKNEGSVPFNWNTSVFGDLEPAETPSEIIVNIYHVFLLHCNCLPFLKTYVCSLFLYNTAYLTFC